MRCPFCNNEYPYQYQTVMDKQRRDEKIREVAAAMKGKQKKVVIAKIMLFLRQHERGLSRSQVYRILKK